MAFDFSTAITADITLYAKWTEESTTPVTYTVTFDPNSGSGTMTPNPVTINAGEKLTLPECTFIPPSADKEFDKWDAGNPGEQVDITSDCVIRAIWKEKTVTTFTVTFDANGHGTAPAAQTVNSGDKATEPTAPTESGWIFGGWYQDATCSVAFDFSTAITADITLYAKWTEESTTPVTYTVTFDPNSGSGTMTPNPVTINAGEKLTLPECTFIPPSADKEFDKWDAGNPGEQVNITSDCVIRAIWKEKAVTTFTVTFDANGHGTAPFAQTVESGKTATKPADPTASGWTFGGWYKEAACNNAFNFSTPITGNITLYAKWTKVAGDPVPATKYTITYVLNGGKLDGKTGTVTVSVEDGATITLPKPTRSGYTFDYWEGSRYEAGASYTVTGDHTFTAQWKANSTTGTDGKDTSPKTGDESHIGLWFALMILSLIGLGGVTIYGRKKRTRR